MLIYATILLFTALYNDYADEDMPDEDVPCDEDIPDAVPAEERSAPPSPTSRSESPANEAAHADSPSLVPSQSCPLPRKPARFGRRSPPLVNVTQIMRLAGGLGPGLAAAISHANTPQIRSVLTGRFPVSGRVATADELQTSAKLETLRDLPPKILRCSHAELRLSTMQSISWQLLQM